MTSFVKSAALTCAAIAVLSRPAGAAAVFVDNFSFESAAVGDGAVSGTHPGWTGGSVFNPTATAVPAVPDGLQVLFLQGGGATGSATQLLAAVLTAGTTYTLQVDVGSRLDFNFIGTYVISLQGTSVVLASATSPTPANGSFVTSSLSYVAGATNLGEALRIRITHTGAGSSTGLFDNVRLDASPTAGNPVPEPSALGLAGLGLAGLAWLRRSRA